MMRQRWAGTGVLLGLLLVTMASRADEAEAIKAVQKLGGKVTVDEKRPGKPVVAVNLTFTKVTDAGLKELADSRALQELDLHGTKVTDAGLKELAGLKTLQTLDLG